ncbi:MAG: hypothetical protein I3I97_02855 [Bifidobacterium thermophilum]|nr:hypothetical protein [Bifidobacterium thermophilum]
MTVITNRITNPRFTAGSTSIWQASGSTLQYDAVNHTLNIVNANSNDAYAEIAVQADSLRGQSMVLECTLSWTDGKQGHQCANGIMLVTKTINGVESIVAALHEGDASTPVSVGRKHLEFTVPADIDQLGIRLYGPVEDGQLFQWASPTLTTAGEYQQLKQKFGLDYFNGSTMPKIQ